MEYFLSYDTNGKLLAVKRDIARAAEVPNVANVVTAEVPYEWGMKTRKGNGRVSVLANNFVMGLVYGNPSHEVAKRFFERFARLSCTKTMSKAGTPEVRDAVRRFARTFAELLGGNELERIWGRECPQ